MTVHLPQDLELLQTLSIRAKELILEIEDGNETDAIL
jgi:hypothetical protein